MNYVDPDLAATLGSTLYMVLSSPDIWLLTLVGVLLGMVVGVLPGFGPPAAMALLFPLVYQLEALPALSLLAGIFYGAKYGGAVTSILLGIPGEADAVATLFEGYPLAQAGYAQQALRLATLVSFLGGMLAVLGMVALAPFLGAMAVYLGSGGRAGLIVAAFALVIFLGPGAALKNTAMVFCGLFLGMVGLDPVHGAERFTLGFWQLMGGVELTALLLGLFGISDILDTLFAPPRPQSGFSSAGSPAVPPLRRLSALGAALRGTLLGFFTGLVPCGAGVTATMASYALEKKLSRQPEFFGKGAWNGLAGPEAANNAAALSSLGPLLLLGLPTNPIMAALLGALTISGVVPGPLLPVQQPHFYWGLIFCLALGNVFLLFLGLGLAPLWARLAQVPYRLLWPVILGLCLFGSYMGAGGLHGPVQCVIFGLCGFALRRLGYQSAPLVLAFVLGPALENYLVQMLMGNGGF